MGDAKVPGDCKLPSDERLRLMIEAVSDYAIFMLDPDGNVASWNVGAQRLKGYAPGEIIGRHFSTFYTEEERRIGHPQYELRRAVAEGRYEEEGWRVRKDGSLFWANVVITAVFDRERHLLGFTKVTRDLTDRRRTEELLRQSEERLRLLVEGVRDYAIFMLDPTGRISTWNTGAQHINGYSADEIIGQHFSIFYPPEDVAAGRPENELRVATAEGRYEEEGTRVRKNGERYWANVVLTAVRDPSTGELRGFAKVTRDLTERRKLEEKARGAIERAAAETARAAEAQQALRMRDEFISVAAHELRTPLTALKLKVQGVMQSLRRDGLPEDAVPKHVDRLQGAVRQVERLAQLVERLLDVSRIVRGALLLNLEDVELTGLVRQVLDDFSEAARLAGCELRLSAGEPIHGTWDRARLEQVMINLLSNATKYGAGKPVDVTVEATPAGARVTVADRGIGISPEDQARIFGRFERAVSISHYGGLGLGLYVARNLVEAHRGTIRVSSQPGQGARFIVELPVSAEGHGPPGERTEGVA